MDENKNNVGWTEKTDLITKIYKVTAGVAYGLAALMFCFILRDLSAGGVQPFLVFNSYFVLSLFALGGLLISAADFRRFSLKSYHKNLCVFSAGFLGMASSNVAWYSAEILNYSFMFTSIVVFLCCGFLWFYLERKNRLNTQEDKK